MTKKQSLLNILIGSLVLALGDSVVFAQGEHLGRFAAAAGFFMLAFVVLLFLTSFVPSRCAPRNASREQQGGARSHEQHSRKPRQGKARPAHQRRAQTEKPISNNAPQQQPEQAPTQAVSTGETVSGTVKWYDKRKGFGFLLYQNSEIFVHRNSLKSPPYTMYEDAAVEFEIGEDTKGPQALNVRVIQD